MVDNSSNVDAFYRNEVEMGFYRSHCLTENLVGEFVSWFPWKRCCWGPIMGTFIFEITVHRNVPGVVMMCLHGQTSGNEQKFRWKEQRGDARHNRGVSELTAGCLQATSPTGQRAFGTGELLVCALEL